MVGKYESLECILNLFHGTIPLRIKILYPRFLMELLEHLMSVFSLSKLVLTVFKSNENAIGFYTKLGFRLVHLSL